MKKDTKRTEVVTEHAHTHRNACDTPTRFVVQREIVGRGRFRCCWRVPINRDREAIGRTVRHETGRCSFRFSQHQSGVLLCQVLYLGDGCYGRSTVLGDLFSVVEDPYKSYVVAWTRMATAIQAYNYFKTKASRRSQRSIVRTMACIQHHTSWVVY